MVALGMVYEGEQENAGRSRLAMPAEEVCNYILYISPPSTYVVQEPARHPC